MKTFKSKKGGFSLVELIIVIAILAVIAAILVPALLAYVERSRTQKDDSAMGEVVNAVMLGLSDQKIYDEVLYSTAKGNVSCYVDSSTEPGSASVLYIKTKAAGNGDDNKEQYMYSDDSRLVDEFEYYFAGNMRGMTITFTPVSSDGTNTKIIVGDGIINKGLLNGARVVTGRAFTTNYYGGDEWTGKKLSELSAGSTDSGHNYLFNKVRATVNDEITLTSQTYRNSEYTVFICMGSAGGNASTEQDAVKVYGQWNGTNLSINSSGNDAAATTSSGPIPYTFTSLDGRKTLTLEWYPDLESFTKDDGTPYSWNPNSYAMRENRMPWQYSDPDPLRYNYTWDGKYVAFPTSENGGGYYIIEPSTIGHAYYDAVSFTPGNHDTVRMTIIEQGVGQWFFDIPVGQP